LLISIIDDDRSAREAITGLVRSLGFITAGFESAADFLQSHDALRTACVIADVHMPGRSGLELHRRLVASGTPTPVVLITAYSDETARVHALQAAASGDLAKPFKPNDPLNCSRAAFAPQAGGHDKKPDPET
jgi:FixJ family two-component response regulator